MPCTRSDMPMPRLSNTSTRMVRESLLEEAHVARLLPVDLEVGDPSVDDDESDRTLAEVLISDAGAVDRPGPTGRGDVRHGALHRAVVSIGWPLR